MTAWMMAPTQRAKTENGGSVHGDDDEYATRCYASPSLRFANLAEACECLSEWS